MTTAILFLEICWKRLLLSHALVVLGTGDDEIHVLADAVGIFLYVFQQVGPEIDRTGGLSDALACLRGMIKEKKG